MTDQTPQIQPLMNEREAATALGLSHRTLQLFRLRGDGPAYLRLSRQCIRYRHEDLTEWLNQRQFRSTSEYADRPAA